MTPALLHSDAPSWIGPLGTVHLLANLMTLAAFAPRVERCRGSGLLLGAFVVLHLASFSIWALTEIPGSYFGIGASGAIAAFALTAIVDAARSRDRVYVAAAALFAVWWWWPDGQTSSDQVHLAGAAVGLAFGLGAAHQWLTLSGIAMIGTLVTVLAEPELPDPPRALDCPDGAYVWDGGEPATLFVRNQRDQPVHLWWVRPDGRRVPIARLKPDDHLLERSFVGHQFVLTDDSEACLDVVEVTERSVRTST